MFNFLLSEAAKLANAIIIGKGRITDEDYIVKEINREQNKILLGEIWFDVDGTGKREAKWHELRVDENGNEMALEWTSEEYGDIWIYA